MNRPHGCRPVYSSTHRMSRPSALIRCLPRSALLPRSERHKRENGSAVEVLPVSVPTVCWAATSTSRAACDWPIAARSVRLRAVTRAFGMTGMGADPNVRSCTRLGSGATQSGRDPPVRFGGQLHGSGHSKRFRQRPQGAPHQPDRGFGSHSIARRGSGSRAARSSVLIALPLDPAVLAGLMRRVAAGRRLDGKPLHASSHHERDRLSRRSLDGGKSTGAKFSLHRSTRP